MTLMRTSAIAARLLTQTSDDAVPLSEISLTDTGITAVVKGAFFEAAFHWNDFFLVFFTDDIPNEEILRIYLLDRSLHILDWARLGAMYSTGHLSGLQIIQPDVLRFHFFGGTAWTLTLLPAGSFAVPVLSDPRGVRRPFHFTRRFNLAGNPQPGDQAG